VVLDAGCHCGYLLDAGTGTGAGRGAARAKPAADIVRTAPGHNRCCHYLALGKAAARLEEIGVWLAAAAVYAFAFFRVESLEERTHLIEYSLVAILIYQALLERARQGRHVPYPAGLAFGATAALGFLDEGIQAILPRRVFDLVDVGFNALAAFMAIIVSMALGWARGSRFRDLRDRLKTGDRESKSN